MERPPFRAVLTRRRGSVQYAALAAVEARVLEELRRVGDEGVSAKELAKAKNILLANYWRQMATIDGKASALGNYDVFTGSYEKLFDEPEQIDAVTRAQLQAVAAAAFRRNNLTVGALLAATADTEEAP